MGIQDRARFCYAMNTTEFRASFPAASQFLLLTFHQDWTLDNTVPHRAIKASCVQYSPEELLGVLSDIARLKSHRMSQSDLDDLLIRLGCSIDVTQLGRDVEGWWTWLEAEIRKHVK